MIAICWLFLLLFTFSTVDSLLIRSPSKSSEEYLMSFDDDACLNDKTYVPSDYKRTDPAKFPYVETALQIFTNRKVRLLTFNT